MEEKELIMRISFHLGDIYGIVSRMPESFEQKTVLDTLKMDIEYAMKLQSLIEKEK